MSLELEKAEKMQIVIILLLFLIALAVVPAAVLLIPAALLGLLTLPFVFIYNHPFVSIIIFGVLVFLGWVCSKVGPNELEWDQDLADKGDIEAQCRLGIRYAEGDMVPTNMGKACEWLRKSAEQGNVKAQERLASLNSDGHVLAADQDLANEGDIEAQCRLGIRYAEGDMVPANMGKACEWLRKSAEQGNVKAQERLALLRSAGFREPLQNALTEDRQSRASAQRLDRQAGSEKRILSDDPLDQSGEMTMTDRNREPDTPDIAQEPVDALKALQTRLDAAKDNAERRRL